MFKQIIKEANYLSIKVIICIEKESASFLYKQH